MHSRQEMTGVEVDRNNFLIRTYKRIVDNEVFFLDKIPFFMPEAATGFGLAPILSNLKVIAELLSNSHSLLALHVAFILLPA